MVILRRLEYLIYKSAAYDITFCTGQFVIDPVISDGYSKRILRYCQKTCSPVSFTYSYKVLFEFRKHLPVTMNAVHVCKRKKMCKIGVLILWSHDILILGYDGGRPCLDDLVHLLEMPPVLTFRCDLLLEFRHLLLVQQDSRMLAFKG